MKFEIFKGKDTQFYFRLKASNGEIVCSSEAYTSKQSCQQGIAVIKSIAEKAEVHDLTLVDKK